MLKMEIYKESHDYECISRIANSLKWGRYLHWHENYEICQIMSKSGKFLIDGELVEAFAGDIIVINRRSVHMFMIDEEDVTIRIMQFPLKALLSIDSAIVRLKTHIKRSEIDKHHELSNLIDSLIEAIAKEPPLKTGDKNSYLLCLFSTLYFALAKYFPSDSFSDDKGASSLFAEAVQYLNDHYRDDDLNVENIAKKLFVSREKLSSDFLKFAGISLKNYLYTLRINEINLLINNGMDIGDAALKCGFNNLRTFNSVYKRLVGMTPTEYLESHNKNKFNKGEAHQ